MWCRGVGERAFCVHFVYASGSGVGQWAPDITPPPPLLRLRLRLHYTTSLRSGAVDLCSTSLCGCVRVLKRSESRCLGVSWLFDSKSVINGLRQHGTTPHHTVSHRLTHPAARLRPLTPHTVCRAPLARTARHLHRMARHYRRLSKHPSSTEGRRRREGRPTLPWRRPARLQK